MNWARRALIMTGFLAFGARLSAQALPADCHGPAQVKLDSISTRAAVAVPIGADSDGAVLAILDSIRNVYRYDAERARHAELLRLEPKWRRDSLDVELQLADVITRHREGTPSSGPIIDDAVWLYRRFSGRPGPLLGFSMPPLASDLYAFDMLRAIRGPLSDDAELAILAYACTSAWVLKASLADTELPKVRAAMPSSVLAADLVLPAAYNLLNPRHQAEFRSFVGPLGYGYTQAWLQEVHPDAEP